MEWRPCLIVALVAFAFDSVLTALVVKNVSYTKIDWDAYMAQVFGFLSGERNYEELRGDTGPLVYPAGFLYVYSAIRYLTGGAVSSAQVIFALLYLVNLGLVLSIYVRTRVVPWWAIFLLTLSKRLHSIFVLRLFNDCVAITLAHASIALFMSQWWYVGMAVFSLAVSVKMSVLLYAPSLLLLLCKALSLGGVFVALMVAALIQVFLGLPFLTTYPAAYISRAFNLGRVFIHFWSVNFKFVPERFFVSKIFALLLMVLHVGLLFLFSQRKWCKHEKGMAAASGIQTMLRRSGKRLSLWSKAWSLPRRQTLGQEHVVGVLFTGNFIGIIAARSLHYQFYSWYFYSLPYLLWKAPLPTPVRLLLLILIESVWNVYPSTATSSLVLLACHLAILWGLWHAPSEYPYSAKKPAAKEKKNVSSKAPAGAAEPRKSLLEKKKEEKNSCEKTIKRKKESQR
ncbi:dol-P-Man:Man(5)GlcNAc(2)-PP-Dol alpha-1,3-mannosyltransferase [Selaginella moellendorffii]|uniref:dol-P-Man:Man(5)GlcNAc(2)-PP-Dol alpha-1,3-mannosyltransferase n=1 Tax=Selaginella moellendorffii TaxID=88036 RepID=UPI000D1C8939|nr:dol-P-Man:Man(5)GlcNAc(2)-PP-Dol alpha-1,3-mannosyltransferase [Selaginella moellendorffii]|eukprot:XP_002971595.2 dol-P-Man:Man(5)GlcNAc(2)-PP-Dol alpha-1,3-mannosyltransferase [Selaginella moellendorffii]